MPEAHGYAALSAGAALTPHDFERRELRPTDVEIEILFCGVCHSDLHMARGEWDGWSSATFPLVPGHEIVGRVGATGAAVTAHRPGDTVAVGCMVDSCCRCDPCHRGLQQYCEKGATFTYGSTDRQTGEQTAGGYSDRIVVDQDFVLRVSPDVDLAATAPILCAGVSTYSPLRRWGVETGSRVGIVGLGGLGHMGVKLAAGMGAEVVVFTTSASKIEDARSLGASEVVVANDANEIGRQSGLDLIIDTVSVPHDLDPYLSLLAVDGAMVLVGVPPAPHQPPAPLNLIAKRRSLAGSNIGGVPETQELLDFCAERGITAEIELIPIEEINRAWERLVAGDVRFRFVIDISTLGGAAA